MPPLPDDTGHLPLRLAKPGDTYVIRNLPGDHNLAQDLTYLGLPAGQECRLMRRLAGGGVIIAQNNLRIALGPDLAETIVVAPAEPGR